MLPNFSGNHLFNLEHWKLSNLICFSIKGRHYKTKEPSRWCVLHVGMMGNSRFCKCRDTKCRIVQMSSQRVLKVLVFSDGFRRSITASYQVRLFENEDVPAICTSLINNLISFVSCTIPTKMPSSFPGYIDQEGTGMMYLKHIGELLTYQQMTYTHNCKHQSSLGECFQLISKKWKIVLNLPKPWILAIITEVTVSWRSVPIIH